MKVLAVIAPQVGGAAVGGIVANVLGEGFDVIAVEDAGADPEALSTAEVILTALSPVTAEHLAVAANVRFVQCATHGFDYVDLDVACSRGVQVSNMGPVVLKRTMLPNTRWPCCSHRPNN